MKQILIIISVVALFASCKKSNANPTPVTPPIDTTHHVAVSTFDTLHMDSLNGATINFKHNQYIYFAYSAKNIPQYTLDMTGAITGDTVIFETPLLSAYGLYAVCQNSLFHKLNQLDDYSVKTTSTSLIVSYKYRGFESNLYQFTWYDSQH